MKWSFLLFSSFLCLQAIAQYPATGNKMRLGWQTTGDGLVYRGAIGDTVTLDPSGINNAWMLLDTANGNLYAYRAKAWRLVSGGGGGVTMPFDSVTFNVNETDASLRELKYSEEKGYLQYGGQDSVQIPLLPGIWYVRNDTSVTIPKGTVVRATGTLGASGRIKVKHMIANGSIDAMYILGIAMQDIAVGADGYAMSQGKIRQVNTQAYSEGAVLYADVDTLGGLTQTEPTGSNLKLPIAFVVNSASNGTIAVRVTSGAYMRDLHDTYITSPDSSASLYYNKSEGIWRDTGAAVLVADTAVFARDWELPLKLNVSDTSVFARDFQISGTANYLAKFTGANTIGNSGFIENGQEVYLGGTSSAFNASRFSIYYNPINNGFPIVADTRAYNSAILPGAGWNFGGKKDSTGAYTAFGAIQGAKETSANSEAGYLQFSTNSDGGSAFPEERMRITSAGNVGIGTASPAYPLHVNGDVNTTGMYKKSGTDIISGTTNRLAMFTGANTVGNSIVTQNGRSMYINSTQDNSGYNISNLFQFNGFGSGAFDQPSIGVIGNVGTTANHRPYLSMYRSAGSTVDDKTLVPYNYHLGSITWQGADGNDFQSRGAEITAITDDITGNNDMPTALFFGTTANGQDQPTERMRITSNGLVGIRNATPVNILDVGHPTNSPLTDATIGLTSTLSAGTSKLALANGTVVKGDVLTTSNATVIGTGGMAIQTTTNSPIVFRTNSSGVESGGNERMRILEGGNVGIATSSPSRPLHVAGTTAIRIPVGNFAQRGTSDNGDIRVRTDTASMEYYSGAWRTVAPMARVPQSGLANRFSKFDANGLLDTSAVLTQSNGRIGINATPTEQLQVGGTVRATRLSVNTFSTQVLSINNYSGSGSGLNVWIGTGGQSTTSGTQNASIGFQAMQSNTVGNYNMAIGSDALKTNTSGSANVAIGAAAMIYNTQGQYNTALGQGALTNSTNSNHNIAIGQEALSAYTQTGEGGNVAIGNASISAKTNGVNDIAIGRYSGYFTDTIWSFTNLNTNSSSSVYIGNFTRTGGNNRENQIIIGHQAIGNGSNTTTIGNSSTTATIFQYGETRLGMAVDSGAYTLQVNGNTKLIGNLARKKPVTIADTIYTVLSDDSWLICNHTAQIKITLPTAANSIGRELMIKYVAGGGATVISNATNVSPIVGGALTNIILPATAGSWVTLVCDGANWIIMQKG